MKFRAAATGTVVALVLTPTGYTVTLSRDGAEAITGSLAGTGVSSDAIVTVRAIRRSDTSVVEAASAVGLDGETVWTAELDLSEGVWDVVAEAQEGSGGLSAKSTGTVTLDTTPSAEAPTLLRPRYYLRVRAVDAAGNATAWSKDESGDAPHRYVNVGRFDGDFNGDGFADFVVGRPLYDDSGHRRGRAEVYFGEATIPTDLSPDATISGSINNEHLGVAAYGAGDLNNDGYDDLIYGSSNGEAKLHFGATDFSFSSADVIFREPTVSDRFTNSFGRDIAPLGDFNGDGRNDMIVGAWWPNGTNIPQAYLFFGEDGPLSVDHRWRPVPKTDSFTMGLGRAW